MKRTTVVLSDPQLKAIQSVARYLGLPFSETVRRLLDEALHHYKAEMTTQAQNTERSPV